MVKIALTCSVGSGKYTIQPRYPKFITDTAAKIGGAALQSVLPVLLPLTDDLSLIRNYAREFDGFLFTGGGDVNPAFYGEKKLDCCGDVDIERDEFEIALLRELIKLDKPVLGICRGIQVMNTALGGTLWQDIGTQLLGGASHTMNNENGEPTHVVKTSAFVSDTCGKDEIVTNSYHHQALKELGDSFKVAAVSCDGVIEAAEHESLRYYKGVQWHPEVNPNEYSYLICGTFLKAAAGIG